MIYRIVALTLTLILAGCGFQLRGSADLPPYMTDIYVQAPNQQSEMVRQLKRLLQANGASLVESRDSAKSLLVIEADRIDRVVQSVGATARVREFALEYRVRYRVDIAGGENRLPARDLEIIRDYTFNEQQVLGAASEEELLRRDLQRTMASRILDQLSAS